MKHLPQEIIRLKRNGVELSTEQLQDFSKGIASGEVSNAQIAAFTMAVYFQNLSIRERVDWTKAVVDSGTTIDWKGTNLSGPILDKHSTGGVGDGVSLMLAPMLASCGVYVPMIAGRGLAHTGGTIDKLESIPGYNTGLSIPEFQKVVADVGCSIICQTSELAPTDSRVYSVRDVTSTVENTGLITASILSKKIAAGIDSLVLDVKTGNGAVMQNIDDSRALSQALVDVANGSGVKTTALITDMSVPLSHNAGNSLEIDEAINFLKGHESHHRLTECVYALGSQALLDAGVYSNLGAAKSALTQTISSGYAFELFSRMIHAMGSPNDFAAKPSKYRKAAPIIRALYAKSPGRISSFDLRKLGNSIVSLGGGRTSPGAAIDHSVGLENIAQIGTQVGPKSESQTPLCIIHAATEDGCGLASEKILNSIEVTQGEVNCAPLIHETIK